MPTEPPLDTMADVFLLIYLQSCLLPSAFQLNLGRFLDVLVNPNECYLLFRDRRNYHERPAAVVWYLSKVIGRGLVLCAVQRGAV